MPFALRGLLLVPWLVVLDPDPPRPGSAPASADDAAIARAIDDGIGWFRNKDFDLLFRVHSPGPEFFLYQPDGADTVRSGAEFRAFAEVFRREGFTYLRHEVKELRVHRARIEDVAWFSALLDDCALVDGREACWRDARWTGVLEKRRGAWVIVQGHLSFTADPARAAVPPDEARVRAAAARDSVSPSGAHPEIERVIRAGLSWARTKDTALLFGTRSQGDDLFVFGPTSRAPVVGFEAFRDATKAFWLKDEFVAKGFDIRELRIRLSPRKSVAWFSAEVDDWHEIGGRPGGWKDARWTGVLEKRGGKWLYVQGHVSFAADRLAPADRRSENGLKRPARRDRARVLPGSETRGALRRGGAARPTGSPAS